MSKAQSQTDDASEIASDLGEIRDRIESLGSGDVATTDDLELVDLRTELKELEDSVEDVRKEVVDEELEDRVEPGDSLHGLKRVESHKKFVDDDVGEVVMRAVSRGIDYTEFVSLEPTTLANDYPDLADVGRYEYTYFV